MHVPAQYPLMHPAMTAALRGPGGPASHRRMGEGGTGGAAPEAGGNSGRRSARWSARSLAVSTTSRSRTPVAMDPGGTPKRPRLRQDAEDQGEESGDYRDRIRQVEDEPDEPELRSAEDAEDTVQNRSSSHSVESSRAAPDHERLHAPMLARGDPLRAVTPWRALPDFAGRARRRNRGSPSRWSTPRLCGKSRSGYSESRSLFNKPL